VGGTATLTFTVTAPNFAGALTNNASVSSNQAAGQGGTTDPNAGNDTASATVQVVSPATLTGTKSVSGTFTDGGTVTYTIIIANGSSTAQQDNPGHEMVDVLPAQLTLVSASATSGAAVATVATNTVTWDGSVPGNGSVTVTIVATIKAGTAPQTVSNTATLNYDADGNGTNESTATTTPPGGAGATTFQAVSPSAVGTHSKSVSGTFSEGGTVTYTVTLSNAGTGTQLDNPGDEFTDVLPAGLTLVSATATTGTPTIDTPTRTVHWNGSLAAGASVVITIHATVDVGTAGQTLSNQGTAFFDTDGNGTNETSVLTDDPSTAAAGDPTSFTVAATAQVPTLSTVGLAALALLLAGGALFLMKRRPA
jgi:uncharacterized repeat protein (TIGR01451 family)